jgi:WG repeat protein
MNCRPISRGRAVSHLTAKLVEAIHRLVAVTMLIAVSSAYFTSEVFGQSSRHLYKVTNKDNKVGFIDKTGKLVIGFDRLPAEAEVGSFSEGFASICFLDKPPSIYSMHCGYIDETGRIVIPPRFVLSSQFSEGLAWIRTETFVGFINQLGNVAFELPDSFSMGFNEGLAAVATQTGWGFIDKTGRFISPKRYVQVGSFSDGLAAVSEGRWKEAKYGFINKTGEVAIPLRFDPRPGPMESMSLSRFTEGLAPVMFGNLYGYIDHKGNTVIPPIFRDAGQFSQGLASITTADGQRGYIDKTGLFVIKLTSGRGGGFNDGLATLAVEIDGRTKMGYIDRTGKTIIEPKFDVVYDFFDGVAKVYFSEKVTSASGPVTRTGNGYIDKRGRLVWRSE